MATVRRALLTRAPLERVWDAVRDIGALHTRLVPGFVTNTVLEGDCARLVTFANGMTVREPIVTLDEVSKRLVWSSEGGITTHYNGSVTLAATAQGTEVVWVADFLPDDAATRLAGAMDAGIAAMQRALDALGPEEPALF